MEKLKTRRNILLKTLIAVLLIVLTVGIFNVLASNKSTNNSPQVLSAATSEVEFPSDWQYRINNSQDLFYPIQTKNLKSIIFSKTVPSGYGVIGNLSTDIKICSKSDSGAEEEIAFVCDNTIYAPEISLSLFSDLTNLVSISFNNFDTSKATVMGDMFLQCLNLTSLDLSGFNTNKLQDVVCMFQDCSKLTNVDLSSFNMSNVTDMSGMFENCSSLKVIKTPKINSMAINLPTLASGTWYDGNTEKTTIPTTNGTSKTIVVGYSVGVIINDGQGVVNSATGWEKPDATSSRTIVKYSLLNNTVVAPQITSFPTATKTGYDFNGWWTEPEGGSKVEAPKEIVEDIKFYAQWAEQKKELPLTWKDEINSSTRMTTTIDPATITSIRFETTAPAGYSKKGTLSTGIEVYANGTNIAFVCANTIYAPVDSSYLFSLSSKTSSTRWITLTAISFNNFNTTNTTNMRFMFQWCSGLTNIDLRSFNTTNVTNMSYMFNDCSGLIGTAGVDGTVIKFGTNFITTKVTNMSSMFYGCSSLTSIDLSSFDTTNTTSINYMFYNCSKLTSLNLSNFNGSKVTNTGSMLNGCSSLKVIKTPKINSMAINLPTLASGRGAWYEDNNNEPKTTMPTTNGTSKTIVVGYSVGVTINDGQGVVNSATGWEKPDETSSRTIAKYSLLNNAVVAPQITSFPTATKTGYDFNGWWTEPEGGSKVEAPKEILGDIKFYAQWTEQKELPLTWKDKINDSTYMGSNTIDPETITSIKFETTAPAGYSKIGALSTGIEVYSNGTNIAFVCANTIYAPEDSNNLFSSLMELQTISFNNFDTTNVTTMESMFDSCSKLTNIDVSSFNTSNVTDMNCMFNGCSKLTNIDVSSFNTSNVTNMFNMFEDCSSLTSLGLTNFNTAKVTNMSAMFALCSSLTTLNINQSNFSTANVTDMSFMFSDCSKLASLNVRGFDTSNVTNMGYMFYGCSSLTNVNLSNFNTNKLEDIGSMFNGCSKLTNIDLSSFNFANVGKTYLMFNDCTSLKVIKISNTSSSMEEIELPASGTWYYNNTAITTVPTNNEVKTIAVGYLVTANANGGEFDNLNGFVVNEDNTIATKVVKYVLNADGIVALEQLTAMPQVSQAGYSLLSWNTNQDGTGEEFTTSTEITADTTIYAHWTQANAEFPTTWKTEINDSTYMTSPIDPTTITSIKFETTIPSGYTLAGTLSTGLTVYKSGTDVAFVWAKRIYITSGASLFSNLTALQTISFDNFDTNAVTDMWMMFYRCSGLTSIDLSSFNTSNVTRMSHMFYYCSGLSGTVGVNGTAIKFGSNFNTSNVTDMTMMFIDCSGLTSIDLSGFDTTNVTDMTCMFSECSGLTSIDLSSFNTSKVISMSQMFHNCSSLTSIDLSSFDTSNVTNMQLMFRYCSSLISLDLSSFDTSKVQSLSSVNLFGGANYCKNLKVIALPKINTFAITLPTPTSGAWYEDNNNEPITTMPKTDGTSKTIAVGYVLTANANGGEFENLNGFIVNEDNTIATKVVKYVLNEDNIVALEQLTAMPQVNKAGYSLLSWNTNQDGTGEEFTTSTQFEENTTIYAQYEINQYTYTFKNEDGSILKTATIAYGETIVAPENPTKASDNTYTYTFAGWTPNFEAGTAITENVTYTATYTSEYINYTVTFKNEDGSVISTKADYHYGDTIVVPETPTKESDEENTYVFNGWNPSLVETVTGNAEYTATFSSTTNQYTYTFYDENGTTVLKTATIAYGETIVAPENPTKASDNTYTYTFAGWTPSFVEGTTITGNVTFTATYTSEYINYTVTFKNEDGSVISTKADYHYGDTVVVPETPTKPADEQNTYVFNGWTPEFNATVTGNAEYTATFSSTTNQYTYTFYDENGTTVLKTATIAYGEIIVAPENPTKASDNTYTYTFAGWTPNFVEGITITGNVTYTATYTSEYINYTVTFKNEDGSVISTKADYHYGDTVIVPTTPTKESDEQNTYVFAGWTPEFNATVTGNVEYTATFSSTTNQYTYTFYDENGTTVLKTATIAYGETIVAPENPTKASDNTYTYTFAGWTPNFVAGTTITGNVTFTATYTSEYINYTITFKNEDGSVISTKADYHYGDTVVVPETPTKESDEENTYVFAGWTPEFNATVTGNVEYTATFSSTTNQYTYTFYDENGTTVLKTATIAYGETIVAPETPTKASDNTYTYTFAGWTPNFEEGTTITGNVTFTATYTSEYINYTVTFKNEDGCVISTKADYHYGDTVVVPTTPTKPADEQNTYVFNGWNPSLVETVTGNVEYTATFNAVIKKVTITLNIRNGKFISTDGWTISADGHTATKIVDYGTICEETPQIEIEKGLNFAGWWTKQEGGEKISLTTAIKNNLTAYAHFEKVAKQNDSTLVIVLIVIGSLVAIILITGSVILIVKKSKSKKRKIVLNTTDVLSQQKEEQNVYSNIQKPVLQDQTKKEQKPNAKEKNIERPKMDNLSKKE